MRKPRRSVPTVSTLAALALVAPAGAAAELPLTRSFEGPMPASSGLTTTACHASLRPGADGVSTRTVVLPAGPGLVEASSRGGGGDVDLALFDAAGRAFGGGASPDDQEVASGWTVTGGLITVQTCRRDGDATGATSVVVEHAALPADATSARQSPPQIVDVRTSSLADRNRVEALGLDLTEGGGRDSVGVTLHRPADALALKRAGFTWDVVVPDLVAYDLAARRAELADARTTSRSALPSGRTLYRTLADYESEMKDLAARNPGLVKLITLPNKTFGGRDVMGIEIAKDVNVADGRPAFMNVGVHHAREWPAGENAMEWALELVNGVKAGDARVLDIVAKSRNVVVPIVNPDGFNASRTAGAIAQQDGGRDESVDDLAYLVAGATTGGEYRRKNCRRPDNAEGAQCLTSAGLAEPGVDPNRNYGGLWGGEGADATNVLAQTYRGPAPFSEPESRNVKEYVGTSQVMTLITNHTTAGLLLRAPGIASLGDPVDENRGYKALGDAMAKENGYFSQKSFELYDTTGTTEDWTYNTAGGYGFTFEVYCGDPNYVTGDCDDPAFHPRFARVVEEYEGTSPQADHENDPGRSPAAPFGNVADYDGKGNREAYFIAAESTINKTRHGVLTGKAPAGSTLRLSKTFKTETSPQPQPSGPDKPILFDDSLESTLTVGDSGTFEWHVNPSTRPIVAKSRGEEGGGTASPAIRQTGSPAGSSSDPNNDGAVPDGGAGAGSVSYNDHPFTVPETGDNRSVTVTTSWTSPASDWDVFLFEDTNGDGKSQDTEKQIGSSAQGLGTSEKTTVPQSSIAPGKKYVLRVANFAAAEPYTVDVTFNGPQPFEPAQVEAWTLTCSRGGEVVDTQQVIIDRDQTKELTLGGACATRGAPAPPADGGGTPPGNGGGTPKPPADDKPGNGPPAAGDTPANEQAATPADPGAPGGGATPASPSSANPGPSKGCSGPGFESARVAPAGRGLRLAFGRRATGTVDVAVFRGSKAAASRLVARFDDRTRSFTWSGRATRRGARIADGVYLVRMTMGRDVRETTLRRRDGRFSVVRATARSRAC